MKKYDELLIGRKPNNTNRNIVLQTVTEKVQRASVLLRMYV